MSSNNLFSLQPYCSISLGFLFLLIMSKLARALAGPRSPLEPEPKRARHSSWEQEDLWAIATVMSPFGALNVDESQELTQFTAKPTRMVGAECHRRYVFVASQQRIEEACGVVEFSSKPRVPSDVLLSTLNLCTLMTRVLGTMTSCGPGTVTKAYLRVAPCRVAPGALHGTAFTLDLDWHCSLHEPSTKLTVSMKRAPKLKACTIHLGRPGTSFRPMWKPSDALGSTQDFCDSLGDWLCQTKRVSSDYAFSAASWLISHSSCPTGKLENDASAREYFEERLEQQVHTTQAFMLDNRVSLDAKRKKTLYFSLFPVTPE